MISTALTIDALLTRRDASFAAAAQQVVYVAVSVGRGLVEFLLAAAFKGGGAAGTVVACCREVAGELC